MENQSAQQEVHRVPRRSLAPSSRSAEQLLSLSSTSPCALYTPSCSSLKQGCWRRRALTLAR